MPWVNMMGTFEADQLDSVKYYHQKAADLIPSWIQPYTLFSEYYRLRLKQYDKAAEMLDLAGKIDSTSILVWYAKANLYLFQNKLTDAEKWYLKTLEASGEDICFPCAHLNLANIYNRRGRMAEAELHLKKSNSP